MPAHSTPAALAPSTPEAKPWWHYGHVWLVIAGPAIVVVAGFVTLVIALRMPDPLVAHDDYRRGLEINKSLAERQGQAMAPALQGRNHAATPAAPTATGAPR